MKYSNYSIFKTELPEIGLERALDRTLEALQADLPVDLCCVDLTAAMCAELGIADAYRPYAALLFVTLGRNKHGDSTVYSFYISHGRGGGRKPGGKINALHDYGNIIDTDIYIVGHTHFPASFRDAAFRVAPHKWSAKLRERLFVNTAAALKYGGYGQRQGYQPASNSYPIIYLSGTEHKMTARV